MAYNVEVSQALMLLGYQTLQLEVLKTQCEQIAKEYNELQEKYQKLLAELEGERNGRLESAGNFKPIL